MFMRRPHASALTPRKTYRDIADGFDRMGNVPVGFAPPGFYPNTGWMPDGWRMPSLVTADGQACQTCTPTVCTPIEETPVGRCVLVGMPRQCIPGCDCETVETSVCADFTCTGIYISPKIACELSLTRIRFGCWDMLANCDAVPAELFACCELDNDQWGAKKLAAGTKICMTFENESEDDIRLHGAFKGILCETC